jgi:hypothetical protein
VKDTAARAGVMIKIGDSLNLEAQKYLVLQGAIRNQAHLQYTLSSIEAQ